MLLETRDVSSFYGQIRALDNVYLQVGEGEIVAMKDPNKTDERELGLLMAGEQLDSPIKEVSQ